MTKMSAVKKKSLAPVLSVLAMLAILAVSVLFLWKPFTSQASQPLYTDRDLMAATQIAYYDFGAERLAAHGGRATVRELLRERDLYRELESKWNHAEGELEKLMAKRNLELYQEIVADGSVYGNWYVADVNDRNESDGFYGILLETDSGHGIIAFRGSESYDANQIMKDWINADFGLLMAKDTTQQEKAAEYMADIENRFSYPQYAVTGHSLGGNLAAHAAIAAPDTMREKLIQTVNFDGPGFSKEYMERHQDSIGKVQHPIDYYRWSLVGALLTQPACARSRIVKVTDDIRPLEELTSNYLRHATVFISFRDGWVQDGTEDLLSKTMGPWSRKVDNEVIEQRNKREQAD